MDDRELDARIAEARRILMSIPGVVGVGYGYRARAGTTTTELTLLVYVRRKKAPADVPPGEMVPRTVLGFPTDVQTVRVSTPQACDSVASYDPLEGGIHISNLKTLTPGGGGLLSFGTLGFFGTINASTSKDRIVLLTNAHVLKSDGGTAGDTIYQPPMTLTGGTANLNRENLHPIGEILKIADEKHVDFVYDGEPESSKASYWIDCATGKVSTCFSSWCDTNCGTGFTIVVHGLQFGNPVSNVIEGTVRVRSADLPSGGTYPVVKVGGKTGRTVGKVTSATGTVLDAVTNAPRNNVIIVENTGPNCEGGTRFSDHGDSGSVYVNSDRKIIGLHFGGDGTTEGHGCHIHPVLKELDITLLARGAAARATGDGTLVQAEIDRSVGGEAVARAAYLRGQILRSERGQVYRTLLERHRPEVVHLINRSRPVTVAWHRLHGPEFLSHILQASRHADYAVPREVGGVARGDAFDRLLATLERNGTPGLRAAIDEHREQLRTMLDASDDLPSLAERLNVGDDAHEREPVA
jgi:hypothetical protein